MGAAMLLAVVLLVGGVFQLCASALHGQNYSPAARQGMRPTTRLTQQISHPTPGSGAVGRLTVD
jgi:hypothetical protein